MDTKQAEVLRLANILRGIDARSLFANEKLSAASATLENQHARITELESQLAQRFDAADMATAAAQGFRDGATATAQPVADPAKSAAYALPDERAAFEAWARNRGYQYDELDRCRIGIVGPEYYNPNTEMAWQAWQARASRGQAPAGATLPDGWVPLTITHEGQYPEEVAYGPQIMMDRLGKWLGKYFAQAAQPDSVQEDAAQRKSHAD